MTASPSTLHFFVPGALDQRTGGYLYDARMVRGLEALAWPVVVHELPGRWPEPESDDVETFDAQLTALAPGSLVLIDGLAGGAHPELFERHARHLRIVALVHHPLGDETGVGEADRERLLALEMRGLAAAAGAIVTSPFTARRLEGLGADPARVRVVIPGTEPAVRAPATPAHTPSLTPGRVPEAWPRSDGSVRLLSVGNVTPRKGHDLLVEALADVADRPWHCIVAGSLERAPEFVRQVQHRVEHLGLTARIDFAGELDDATLTGLLESADVFVLPSWYEGYGMALTEALQHGLPVISTTGGAIADTVPAAAGRLVTPGDARVLSAALAEVLDSPGTRQAMAAAARQHAAALPNWSQQVAQFAGALTNLAADRTTSEGLNG